MAIPLNVLIIEDSDNDAALNIRALEKAGYKVTHEIVANAKEMKAALANKAFDLIIADHNLPQFDSLGALAILKESGKDIPFIIISGTIGEEIAVKLMKAGAQDYVMKNNLNRLGPAVERELRDAEVRREHKKTEEALVISEQNYRDSIENLPFGVRIVTKDGKALYANRALLDIFGYPNLKKLEAVPSRLLYTPESYDAHRERVKKRKQGEYVSPKYGISIVRSDGQIRFLSVYRGEVLWNGEKQFQVMYEDITQRSQAEGEVLLKSELLDNATDMILLHEPASGTQLLYLNEIMCDLLGYTEKELLSMKMSQIVAPEIKSAKNYKERATSNDLTSQFESIWVRKDGSRLPVEVSRRRFNYGDRRLVLASAHDITERKQAQEALEESENLYRSLFENMLNGFAYCKMLFDKGQPSDFIYLAVNQAFEKHTGLKDVVGKKVSQVIPGIRDSDPHVFEIYGRVALSGIPESLEIYVSSLKMWFSISVYSPKKEYFVAIFDVITERKKAEEELKLRAQLLDSATDSIYLHDFNGNIIYANEKTALSHGYTRDELAHIKLPDLLASNKLIPERQKYLIEKGEQYFVTTHLRKDGSIMPMEVHSRSLEVNGKKFALTVAHDITERKRLDDELKLKSQILDNSSELVYTHEPAPSLRLLYVNDMTCKKLGYSRDEMLTMKISDIVPDFTKGPRLRKEVGATGVITFEGDIRRKDGSLIPIEASANITQINGQVLILSSARDITERKQSKEKLEQSYQKLQKTVESTIQTIALTSETRDPYTAGHQRRVAILACAIGKEIGLSKKKIEGLHVAGILHDIGKIHVPSEILSKPGKLSEAEMSLIKTHPEIGRDILKTLELPWKICPIVLQHHERIDGSGYPSGLSGENISIEARIIAVADVVEAMSSHRPYRPSLGIESALDEIAKNKGKLYDLDVVDACLKLFNEKRFKFDHVPG